MTITLIHAITVLMIFNLRIGECETTETAIFDKLLLLSGFMYLLCHLYLSIFRSLDTLIFFPFFILIKKRGFYLLTRHEHKKCPLKN